MTKRTSSIFHVLFSSILWKKKSKEKILYLTFDDGPTDQVTDYVLYQLKSRNIKAAFFVLGNKVESSSTLLSKIKLEGHQVGNHTFNHENGWSTSLIQYLQSVKMTQRLLEKYGFNKKRFFRPPYGRISLGQLIALRTTMKIIGWSLMAYDFDKKQAGDECLALLKAKTRSGDIIVFHDNEKSFEKLKYVLPRYLDYCINSGYRFGLL